MRTDEPSGEGHAEPASGARRDPNQHQETDGKPEESAEASGSRDGDRAQNERCNFNNTYDMINIFMAASKNFAVVSFVPKIRDFSRFELGTHKQPDESMIPPKIVQRRRVAVGYRVRPRLRRQSRIFCHPARPTLRPPSP